MEPVRGKGIYLYDKDDTEYMDFTSGIGVVNTGHAHPKIVQAIQEQASQLIFGQMNVVIVPAFVKLSHKLHELFVQSNNSDNINSFFFANSGAEATEAAVKLVRHASNKRNIIVMEGSFHGRTAQCMAMTTSKYIYRHNYQPLPSGVFVTPFPNSYYMFGKDTSNDDDDQQQQYQSKAVNYCMQALERLVATQSSPEETAAIFIEPVLGEGGYVPAPPTFLRALRDFCTTHNILLVVDEIQTGMGRTGQWFAYQHHHDDVNDGSNYNIIQPDVVVMAKGLGSGMPIGAVGASVELMERWKVGTHGGTYGGGNALVAAAACATIDVLREDALVENAAKMGSYLKQRLKELQKRYPDVIGQVRGLGLMVGVEFSSLPNGKTSGSDVAQAVRTYCVGHRLLILTCGPYGQVIRFIPPLVVTKEEMDKALEIFEQAIQQLL